MILRSTGLVLCMAGGLVACSPETPDTATPSVTTTAENQAAATPETPIPEGVSLAKGSALTGQVSSLSGQITGFAVRQTELHTVVELASDVLFDFDSAQLAPDAEAALRHTAELAAAAGSGRITVVGHTDAKGDDAYNLALSRRRAEAVANWLSTSGKIAADRLQAEGRGEADPVARNTRPDGQDDPQGRARNRRVEVSIPRP